MRLAQLWDKAVPSLIGLCASAAIWALAPAPVSAQGFGKIACGDTYTVVRGDTLNQIAVRAYGSGQYLAIYRANRSQLPNPTIIEVDQQLLIPCLDGSGPQTVEEYVAQGGVITPPEAQIATIRPIIQRELPSGQTIKFLTGSDYAPFTDESMPEGGLITELVKNAMRNADENRPYRITFINDWGPHLSVLLPEGAFDLGFPWFKPDCTKMNRLSDDMRLRCTDYDFSDPFFEVTIGYYVKAGSSLASATSYDDLKGKVICRPRGYFTFDLEQEGLKDPEVIMLTLPDPESCFRALKDGVADVVSLNVWLAKKEIKKLGTEAETVELTDLSTVQTLHVLSPKTNPDGPAYLSLINSGLRGMRESGQWFEIVARQMTEHGKRVQ
ncbi:transporter substrate-binding domain-containing protein [Rhodobacteraceae bacterium NNCM2]|nr:transporter substrate-binding domain-containing protein [Coraliihabitans acroporae]